MTITFVGHGYVGLVTACVFADLGNTVYVIGRTPEKLERLKKGDPLIFEPGLSELLKKNIAADRLFFTDSYESAISQSEVVFITVGTPPKKNGDGEADLSSVLEVAENIGKNLGSHYTVVSCKSTVPVGTNRKIEQLITRVKAKNTEFDTASCPEFLREGSALSDTFNPDRIIIGSDSKKAIEMIQKLHEPLSGERVVVGLESAEVIKYASNSFLATKISFANLIAFLCEKTGANVEEVLDGVGLDARIGRTFLNPGVGYGGSCFPKDVSALIATGKSLGLNMQLLEEVSEINKQARQNIITKIKTNSAGKNIAIWGLAFKPQTDDVRDAPSVDIIRELLEESFSITVYDPEAIQNTEKIFKKTIKYVDDPYKCVQGADCLVILTEWNEFKQIDLTKVISLMDNPMIIDGRNMYDPLSLTRLGFTYISVGR